MLAAINKFLISLGVQIPQTDREVVGGYFIWLTLPGEMRGDVVTKRAREEEELVVAEGGSKFAFCLCFLLFLVLVLLTTALML
jgi:hypothetical protein